MRETITTLPYRPTGRPIARAVVWIGAVLLAVAVIGHATGHSWLGGWTAIFTAAATALGVHYLHRTDPDRGSAADRALWGRARTLLDLGRLTADWLNGDIMLHPSYPGGGPDEETDEITFPLRMANLAGYVTIQSQPHYDGEGYDGARWRQRAAVEGVADDAMRTRLHRIVQGTGLELIEYRGFPRRPKLIGKPVVRREDEDDLWFGHPMTRQDLKAYRKVCSAAAMQALRGSWQITLIDPDWDRPDHLWDVLLAEFDGTPESEGWR